MEGVSSGRVEFLGAGGEVDLKALRAVDRPLEFASTLPGPIFSDPRIHDLEMQRIFRHMWQCVGRVEEVARPGDFITTEVGGSGVLIVRGRDDELRGFHNVCRHRGSRLLEAPSGSGLGAIRCPYHAWTYDLMGHLLVAPHMEIIEDFERGNYGLMPILLEVWRGFLFINLDTHAEPLAQTLGGLVTRAAPYPLEGLRRAHRVVYEVNANWKLVVENAGECYHCPGIHPQLQRLTPYRSGDDDLLEGPVFGGWMDFVEDCETLAPDGRSHRSAFQGPTVADLRRVYYYFLFPGNFFSFLPDYVTFDRFAPLGPDKTRVVFDLFVDEGAQDPAEDAMEFWDLTNRQDWRVCEVAHRGSKTQAYSGGRYSEEEEMVHAIDRYYIRRMGFLRSRA